MKHLQTDGLFLFGFVFILCFSFPFGKSSLKFFRHLLITVFADRFEIDFYKLVPFRLGKEEEEEERKGKSQDTGTVVK